MRVTIIPDDAAISVGGRFIIGIDMSSIPTNVHAVQWYETWGEVEFKDVIDTSTPPNIVKPQNEIIADISPYQAVIDLWTAARDEEGAATIKN